jgi:hypothetical protein
MFILQSGVVAKVAAMDLVMVKSLKSKRLVETVLKINIAPKANH